ncbi:hypothetical protein BJX99DRAFT_253011 [Aspergillus californicus]
MNLLKTTIWLSLLAFMAHGIPTADIDTNTNTEIPYSALFKTTFPDGNPADEEGSLRWTLDKRANHKVQCDTGDRVSKDNLKARISFIRTNKKQPFLKAGFCERVSCRENSAVFWCNSDAVNERRLPSWDNIADGAQTVLDSCMTTSGASGMVDHPDNWRALVYHHSDLGCP